MYKYLLISSLLYSTSALVLSATIDDSGLERVNQELVSPPLLPEHQQAIDSNSKIIQARLVIEEKEIEIAKGLKINAITYNGSVPGPIIVAHEDDTIELTIVNSVTNTLPYNMGFQKQSGFSVEGTLADINPGEETIVRFKAPQAGVFLYFSTQNGEMNRLYTAMGLSGTIMILPREGLKDNKGHSIQYNKAYYIGEQGFYRPKDENGEYQRFNSVLEALPHVQAEMSKNIPSHIVFNGAVGSMTGKQALTAQVGEKVLFIHSQANENSRPHLIGGHGDYVWENGLLSDKPMTGRETWFIPRGTAVAAFYEFKQPNIYVYLNHNLIQAIQLGAAAHVKVDGEWNFDLMERTKAASAIQ